MVASRACSACRASRTGRERGVALITAMLIVALATSAAVAMVAREHVDLRRSGNLLQSDQAYSYCLGGEAWAGRLLQRDRDDNETDDLGEPWAQGLPPLPVEGGVLSGYIEDMQGRFNVNSLVNGDEVDEVALQRFRRLLTALEIEPDIAEAVVDWLDSDTEPRFPGGAEDGYYSGLNPAYRAANQPMTSASELRQVLGIDAEVFEKLRPHVTALPGRTPINVNTATAPVLRSLADELTAESAAELQRVADDPAREDPYGDLQEFLAAPQLAGLAIPEAGLSVSSEYFVVHVDARIGDTQALLRSLLHRSGPEAAPVVVLRVRGLSPNEDW